MAGTLQQWFNLFIFTTARRIYTLTRVKQAAEELGHTEFAAFVGEKLLAERATFAMEAEWKRSRPTRVSKARGRSVEIDNSNDRLVGAIGSQVQKVIDSLNASHPVHKMALEFKYHFFSDGVASVTHQSFEEQLVTMEEMLVDLAGPFAEHVEKLNVGLFVDQLAIQVPEFGAELEAHPTTELSFDQIRAARDRGQEALLAVLGRGIGIYYGTSPEHVAGRKQLLGPIREQNDRIAALRRSRRRNSAPIDIDPNTGEEFVIDVEDVIEDVEAAVPVGA